MVNYFAVVEQDDTPGYSVFFPDFPGCTSAGDTITEAITEAHDALQGHIDIIVEDGDTLPAASDPAGFIADPEVNVACIAAISVNIPQPAKRVQITLPGDLIEAIDQVAPNRSGFLAEAAREKLKQVA